MFYDGRERSIRRTLRQLARQRLAMILPNGIWVIEYAVGSDEETEQNLRTCHLRGWVEPIHDGVPSTDLTSEARLPEGQIFNRKKTIYRLTDGGWNALNRAHWWTMGAAIVGLLSLIIAILALRSGSPT